MRYEFRLMKTKGWQLKNYKRRSELAIVRLCYNDNNGLEDYNILPIKIDSRRDIPYVATQLLNLVYLPILKEREIEKNLIG
jgi:hypothetical protein